MSSLVVNFNQFVDLAVNPSMGTINTSLLQNLFHIIINQLQLSSSFIEFHGTGSATIENYILNNQHGCGLEINEFEIKEEVDEATGNIVQRRKEIKATEMKIDESLKLFTVKNVETNCKYPMGYPLSPIQVLSIEKIQEHQTENIHKVVIANVLPSDDKFTDEENPEKPLKAMFDYINVSKRLDALEVGIRQFAEILKKTQCESEKVDSTEKEIDPMITLLSSKVSALTEQIDELKLKCNNIDFHEKPDNIVTGQNSQDNLSPLMSEIESLKTIYKATFEEYQQEITQFKIHVCERLDCFKNDLVGTSKEIQDMLDGKLDKIFVPEIKEYLQRMILELEEKIEKVDCKKPLAAGSAKKIINDLNCVSCGENIIQADACNPTQSMLTRNDENYPRHNNINELQLLKLPTRLCGGNHTITTPRERIFRSKNCQS
jgi:hypothetical protein